MYRVCIVINSGIIAEIYAAYKPTTTHRIYSISQKNALLFADVQFLLYLCTENEEVIYYSAPRNEACAAACVLCAVQFRYRGMVVRT